MAGITQRTRRVPQVLEGVSLGRLYFRMLFAWHPRANQVIFYPSFQIDWSRTMKIFPFQWLKPKGTWVQSECIDKNSGIPEPHICRTRKGSEWPYCYYVQQISVHYATKLLFSMEKWFLRHLRHSSDIWQSL